MHSFAPKAIATFASVAALFALSACSDTTAPTSLRAPDDAAFTIGTTANVGTVKLSFGSSAATEYCSAATLIHDYSVPAAPFGPLAGCGTAFDLQTALTTSYNPGWSAPIAGSSWIGPNATSNEYRTAPGRYVFQHRFTIPTGAVSIVLNDSLKSDNAVSVYVNGFKLEQQTIADCNPAVPPCNWNANFVISDNNQSHFHADGVANGNTITVVVIDTPNGGTAGNGYACTTPFQPFGELGFGTPFNVPTSPSHVLAGWTQTMTATTGCENPTGLDFHGNVSWTVPVTTWCSPGYWKNHLDAWSLANQNKLYSTLVGAAPLKAGSPSGATLVQVISNPQIFGGPATNSVADYLSFIAFGTPIGTGIESCPLN